MIYIHYHLILTDLKFPAADKREHCLRSITEIQAWKKEQKFNRIQ
jgi:hypothetical protein